jgi:hypothetical protein
MAELGFTGAASGGQAEKYYGKYPGVVRDNKPPAGQAHVGELLVEVPGILEEAPGGAGEQAMQVWARPCFVPGFFFIPEVGAPVWVEFAAGDINQPLWTGVWYPTDAVPQTADGQAPTEFQKVIRTASGHVIQLDDTSGSEKLVITDKSGNQIVMDSSGIKMADCSGNEIVMASGGITLKSTAIKLGSDSASEPLVLGNQWMKLFNMHVHLGNMGAPTSPPTGAGTPATPAHISAKHVTQ